MTCFVVQECDALTADGGIVRIRPAADGDAVELARL